MDQAQTKAQAASLSFRGTTRSGVKLKIDIAREGIAIGETLRGTVTVEGDQRPEPDAVSAELVAISARKSATVDLAGLAANLLNIADDESERDPIPMKDKVVRAQLAAISVPLQAGPDGAFHFAIAIPADAPPHIRTKGLAVSWTLRVKVETATPAEAILIQDLPVVVKASRLAAMAPPRPGTLDKAVSGSAKELEWSIEIDALPLVAGETYRGTLVATVPDKLRTVRPTIRLQQESNRLDMSYGTPEWSEAARVVEDGFDETGRRRIVFEGSVPKMAAATVSAGDMAVFAAIEVTLYPRWSLSSTKFERPVAIASVA